jgi:hypothetical protein
MFCQRQPFINMKHQRMYTYIHVRLHSDEFPCSSVTKAMQCEKFLWINLARKLIARILSSALLVVAVSFALHMSVHARVCAFRPNTTIYNCTHGPITRHSRAAWKVSFEYKYIFDFFEREKVMLCDKNYMDGVSVCRSLRQINAAARIYSRVAVEGTRTYTACTFKKFENWACTF